MDEDSDGPAGVRGLNEVGAKFSVSLEAESAVLISKVSGGAAFEVSLKWVRRQESAGEAE